MMIYFEVYSHSLPSLLKKVNEQSKEDHWSLHTVIFTGHEGPRNYEAVLEKEVGVMEVKI